MKALLFCHERFIAFALCRGVLIILMLCAGVSASAQVLQIDADQQFSFAEHCLKSGDYAAAVSEFKRFIYFFPMDPRIESAQFTIGLALYSAKRYGDAEAAFLDLIAGYKDTKLALQAHILLAQCYAEKKAFGQAVISLRNLISLTTDAELQDEARYRTGWAYVEMLEWENARKYFESIGSSNRERYRVPDLLAELQKADALPYKDPTTAGALAVLPGAGYLYLERYQDALIAFLLNGALIWAAADAFSDDHHALGGLLTFVEFGFYGGNIYGSISSAHKHNVRQSQQFIESVRQRSRLSFSTPKDGSGIVLSLRYEY